MKEMEPQRRPSSGFVRPLEANDTAHLNVADGRGDRCKIQQHRRAIAIELRFLNRQVDAQPLAVRMPVARCMRWLIVLLLRPVVMMAAFRHRMFASGFLAAQPIVLMMPAATQRCMDQQRAGNQAGK